MASDLHPVEHAIQLIWCRFTHNYFFSRETAVTVVSVFVPTVARIKCSNPVWEPQVWEEHVNLVKRVLLEINLNTVIFLSLTLQLLKPKKRLYLFVLCVILPSKPSSIDYYLQIIFHHCSALKETRRRTTRWLLQWFLLFLSFTVEHFTWTTKILQLMLPQNSSWGSFEFFFVFVFVCPKFVTPMWTPLCQNGELFLAICCFHQSPLLFIKASH